MFIAKREKTMEPKDVLPAMIFYLFIYLEMIELDPWKKIKQNETETGPEEMSSKVG